MARYGDASHDPQEKRSAERQDRRRQPDSGQARHTQTQARVAQPPDAGQHQRVSTYPAQPATQEATRRRHGRRQQPFPSDEIEARLRRHRSQQHEPVLAKVDPGGPVEEQKEESARRGEYPETHVGDAQRQTAAGESDL